MKRTFFQVGLLTLLCSSSSAEVQDPTANGSTIVGWDYQISPNIVCKKASGPGISN